MTDANALATHFIIARHTAAEMAEGFRRFAAVAAKLPRIEMRRVWFWQRDRLQREGWMVRPGLRPFAMRMQPAR